MPKTWNCKQEPIVKIFEKLYSSMKEFLYKAKAISGLRKQILLMF